MSTQSCSNNALKEYPFPLNRMDQIPRYSITDPRVDERISNGEPVVITDVGLVDSARKWSLEYLKENIGGGNFSVYHSTNHMFKYYDEKKLDKNLPGNVTFMPPTRRVEMKFSEFYDLIKKPPEKDKRIYLQQGLNDTVGPNIVHDFLQFNWKWVTSHQERNKWGPLTSNLLLISQAGNVTPCHYDEQENFFAQVEGRKRVIVFPPSQFECLYPYPVYHPHDRQCQVNLENPNFQRFPKFLEAKGREAVLGPGDVFYLPSYWFHHFETLSNNKPDAKDDICTSITFWYKAAPVGQIVRPLRPHQKMAVMRNIEKMVLEALGTEDELVMFMETMVIGRYADDLRTPKLNTA